ncbi:hypothetical protein ACFQX6_08005 [Streptosporangium lutulentum]
MGTPGVFSAAGHHPHDSGIHPVHDRDQYRDLTGQPFLPQFGGEGDLLAVGGGEGLGRIGQCFEPDPPITLSFT